MTSQETAHERAPFARACPGKVDRLFRRRTCSKILNRADLSPIKSIAKRFHLIGIGSRAAAGALLLAALLFVATLVLAALPCPASAQATRDWVTCLPRETLHIKSWPGGKKVAVAFVLYVETWGFGRGPNLRNDMVSRDPDVVDEAFRQYAIEWGLARVGRVFKEEQVPLSFALNALFPSTYPDVWRELRASAPNAPIIGHGMNNSTQLLPLGNGLAAPHRKTISSERWS